MTLLAGGEQRRNTPGRLLVDWRTMGQQQVHEGGVVVASSKVQTGIRSLRALPLESRRDICPVRQEQLDDFLVILFTRPCQGEVTFPGVSGVPSRIDTFLIRMRLCNSVSIVLRLPMVRSAARKRRVA